MQPKESHKTAVIRIGRNLMETKNEGIILIQKSGGLNYGAMQIFMETGCRTKTTVSIMNLSAEISQQGLGLINSLSKAHIHYTSIV